MSELQAVYDELCTLLRKHASDRLELVDELENSQAKQKKPTLILQGKTPLQILKNPRRKTYVAGVMLQKHHVGFYFMPMYGSPENAFPLSPALQRANNGKACFQLKKLDPHTKKDLDALLSRGVEIFGKRGWI